MKNKKYNFVFNLGDRVKITDLDIKGYVNALYITTNEITYRIRYVFNGDIKEVYFTNNELELVDDYNKSLGFKHDDKK